MPNRMPSSPPVLTGLEALHRMRGLRQRLGAPATRRLSGSPGGRGAPARGAGDFTPLERVMRRSQWLKVIGGSHLTLLKVQALLRLSLAARPALRERSSVFERQRLSERIVERERWLMVRRTTPVPVGQRPAQSPPESTLRRIVSERGASAAAARLVMTLARLAPAASAAPVAGDSPALPGSALSQSGQLPRPARSTAPAAELTLPPQELSRVTEHVFRQLDRRVLSHQERNGF